jgi:hypothetical protein
MNRQASGIASVLDELGIAAGNVSVVTIGPGSAEIPGAETAHTYETLSAADELPHDLRAQLGVVVAPREFMSRKSAEQLLSRLRDVHCDKILLFDVDARWNAADLRALGYLEVKRPSVGGRCYLFDPDVFNQPREWNNPSDWANPENFRKYRW